MKRKNLKQEWEKILTMENESPYVFRTRVERTINHSLQYAEEGQNESLISLCENMKNKMKYLSDQSNQTSDGTLNSFIVLENEMQDILKEL